MSKELIKKAENIRDEVRVGANTAKRVGGFLEEMSREVNGLYDNVLDWINNEKPQGGGFILTQSDVINSLSDDSELKPLSANQGKILKAILDVLVVDDLSTNDKTKALSANQGKILADNFKNHNHDDTYQEKGDYATALHIHNASEVTEENNKLFMTNAERSSLSSLGTHAAMKDFSNVTTQSLGQNGYCKFPNGLLLQWGKAGANPTIVTIYLNMAYFLDSDYSVVITPNNGNGLESGNLVSPILVSKATSYFKACVTYITTRGDAGYSSWPFTWFAIGRWK